MCLELALRTWSGQHSIDSWTLSPSDLSAVQIAMVRAQNRPAEAGHQTDPGRVPLYIHQDCEDRERMRLGKLAQGNRRLKLQNACESRLYQLDMQYETMQELHDLRLYRQCHTDASADDDARRVDTETAVDIGYANFYRNSCWATFEQAGFR